MGKDRWTHGNRGGNKRGGFNRGGFRGRGRSRGGFRGHSGNRDRVNNDHWKRNETPGIRLSEADIGVTEYMSNHEGFNGIIKQRFSDFQVSEINEQGEVAKLTDMKAPEPESEEITEDEELLLNKYNVEILPLETWDQINKVIIGEDPEFKHVEIDVTTSSKEERTKIHEAVKKAFGESIIGSTVTVGDNKMVRFEKYRKGVRFDRRVKWIWGGHFVHFVVHKEHCDTMEAASRITDQLMRNNMRPPTIGYSGTKDRRAKTSQWFSLKKVDPRKIANACKHLNMIHVGNYTFKDYDLKLGMLKGNKFRIALRNVTASNDTITKACSSWKDSGFLNYYGLQRFGSRHDLPTHLIGKLVLQGNYMQAIKTILTPNPGPMHRALAVFQEENARSAVQAMPRYNTSVEAKLLMALADNDKDVQGALFRIPRNTLLLYLHSYQSLLWNKVVSERIRRFGLHPAVGDIVPVDEHYVAEEPDNYESDTEEKEPNQDTTENIQENKEDPKTDSKIETPKEKEIPIKILSQEDIDNKTYSIFDIVMPLPGYSIQYPANMKDYYEKLLTDDGLTMELKNKNKNFSLSGAYRRMCIRPDDVQWSTVQYSDPHGDLIVSDLDLLEGRTETAAIDDGKYKALLISFSLPSSCYATMALRELLKVDTSSNNQASQNNYHKRKISESEDTNEKRLKIETSESKDDTSESRDETSEIKVETFKQPRVEQL